MEGLLFFEASVVATTLIGEPMWVICALGTLSVIFAKRLTDELFFIFCGALCVTMLAKWFDWKTKRDETLYWMNILEAIALLTYTCFVFPKIGISLGEVARLGRVGLMIWVYKASTERFEPSILISVLYLLSCFGFDPLATVVFYTFAVFLLISLYLKIKR
jgi:hypothetical protein